MTLTLALESDPADAIKNLITNNAESIPLYQSFLIGLLEEKRWEDFMNCLELIKEKKGERFVKKIINEETPSIKTAFLRLALHFKAPYSIIQALTAHGAHVSKNFTVQFHDDTSITEEVITPLKIAIGNFLMLYDESIKTSLTPEVAEQIRQELQEAELIVKHLLMLTPESDTTINDTTILAKNLETYHRFNNEPPLVRIALTGNVPLILALFRHPSLATKVTLYSETPSAIIALMERLTSDRNRARKIIRGHSLPDNSPDVNPLHTMALIGDLVLTEKICELHPEWAIAVDEAGFTPIDRALAMLIEEEEENSRKRYELNIEVLLQFAAVLTKDLTILIKGDYSDSIMMSLREYIKKALEEQQASIIYAMVDAAVDIAQAKEQAQAAAEKEKKRREHEARQLAEQAAANTPERRAEKAAKEAAKEQERLSRIQERINEEQAEKARIAAEKAARENESLAAEQHRLAAAQKAHQEKLARDAAKREREKIAAIKAAAEAAQRKRNEEAAAQAEQLRLQHAADEAAAEKAARNRANKEAKRYAKQKTAQEREAQAAQEAHRIAEIKKAEEAAIAEENRRNEQEAQRLKDAAEAARLAAEHELVAKRASIINSLGLTSPKQINRLLYESVMQKKPCAVTDLLALGENPLDEKYRLFDPLFELIYSLLTAKTVTLNDFAVIQALLMQQDKNPYPFAYELVTRMHSYKKDEKDYTTNVLELLKIIKSKRMYGLAGDTQCKKIIALLTNLSTPPATAHMAGSKANNIRRKPAPKKA